MALCHTSPSDVDPAGVWPTQLLLRSPSQGGHGGGNSAMITQVSICEDASVGPWVSLRILTTQFTSIPEDPQAFSLPVVCAPLVVGGHWEEQGDV